MQVFRIHRGGGGFSLIEVMASIVIMGLIGSIAGLGIIQIVDGFFVSKQNAETLLNGQIAMARLVKELTAITGIAVTPLPTLTSVTYTHNRVNPSDIRTISFDSTANQLEVNGDVLTDRVSRFQLRYYPSYAANTGNHSGEYNTDCTIIEIFLELMGAQETAVSLENRVFLRGLVQP